MQIVTQNAFNFCDCVNHRLPAQVNNWSSACTLCNVHPLPPDLSASAVIHAVIAPKRRVAACIFGLLPRYHFTGSHVEQGTLAVTTAFKADKAEHDFSAERLLQAIVVPSFDQYLVKPNAAGFQVDVFVHNGEARRRSLLLDAWNPQALHVGDEGIDRPVSLPGTNGWPGGATPRMFASIESVLRFEECRMACSRSALRSRCLDAVRSCLVHAVPVQPAQCIVLAHCALVRRAAQCCCPPHKPSHVALPTHGASCGCRRSA